MDSADPDEALSVAAEGAIRQAAAGALRRSFEVLGDERVIPRSPHRPWIRMAYDYYGHAVERSEGALSQALADALPNRFEWRRGPGVDMPRVDGFELCRRMKADLRLRSIPFVMVTQHDRVTDLIRALEVGADNFLTKPLDAATAVARVGRIVTAVGEWRERAATRRHHLGIPPDQVLLSFERGQLVEMLMNSAQQLETELDTVAELGLALTQKRQLPAVLRLLAGRARELSEAETAVIALRDPDAGTWTVRDIDSRGNLADWRIERRYSDPSSAILEKLRRHASVRITPEENGADELLSVFGKKRSGDVYLFAISAADAVVGVMALSFGSARALTANERRRYEHLANHAAVAIENARLFEEERTLRTELEEAYREVKEAHKNAMFMLAAAVEARDGLTGTHLCRVQSFADALGRAIGLSEEELEELAYSCVMHDVGKLLVPDAILGKPGKLSEEEWVEMRRHPEYGAQILGDRDFFRVAREIAHCHHERWDGTGYPRGLKGDEIPLAARITSVADVFDASADETILETVRAGVDGYLTKDQALADVTSAVRAVMTGEVLFPPEVLATIAQRLDRVPAEPAVRAAHGAGDRGPPLPRCRQLKRRHRRRSRPLAGDRPHACRGDSPEAWRSLAPGGRRGCPAAGTDRAAGKTELGGRHRPPPAERGERRHPTARCPGTRALQLVVDLPPVANARRVAAQPPQIVGVVARQLRDRPSRIPPEVERR